MDKELEQETRKMIYDLIEKNPGLHLSKIAELLEIRISLAEYHLLYMERNEYIFSIKKEGKYYRRYYTKDTRLGAEDKKILALLRQKTMLRILIVLSKHDGMRRKDMVQHFNIAPPTITYYINKLVECGLIKVISSGEDKGYHLLDKKRVGRNIL